MNTFFLNKYSIYDYSAYLYKKTNNLQCFFWWIALNKQCFLLHTRQCHPTDERK